MIWSFGRAVVWIKRLALATERIAIAEEDMARLFRMEYAERHPERRAPRSAEFGVADISEDWNKTWLVEHPEEAD